MSGTSDAPNLKSLILCEATRLFATRGFAGTTIREVASSCDCTKPALYHYFSSKEALFREVVEHHTRRITAIITNTVESTGSVRERLHAGVDSMLDYGIEEPLVMRLLQRVEISAEENAPLIDACVHREMHLQMLAGLMRMGIESGELRPDLDPIDGSLLLAGATHFQLEQSISSGQWDRERIHRTIDLVLDGIAA